MFIRIVFVSGTLLSNLEESERILDEGKLLYRMEKAAWYATDDMFSRYRDLLDSLGGYVSYETENHTIKTAFFSRFDNDRILFRYEFDSIPKELPLDISRDKPNVIEKEKKLIAMRLDAMQLVMSDEEGFFKHYENTSFNFIPLIHGDEHIVYILTGPQQHGNMIIGNDYKLVYSSGATFIEKEKVHNSLLTFPYTAEGEEMESISATYHSHVNSDFISPTDICTLLLYKDYIEWDQHYVMSKDYVSIFDLKSETLVILTKDAWDRMNSKEE